MITNPSGNGFFGFGAWGKRVFWLNVPSKWRELDTDHYLELLLKSWGDLGEDFIKYISQLPDQRDPYRVRTKSTYTRWMYITESFDFEDDKRGRVVRLIEEKDFALMPETDESNPPSTDLDILSEQYPWFPYEPVKDIGSGWILTVGDANYTVVNTRTRNFDPTTDSNGNTFYNVNTSLGNEIWVSGGDLTLIFDYISNRVWDRTIDTDKIQGTIVIGETDGSQRPVCELPITPVRLDRNATHDGTSLSDSTVIISVPIEPFASWADSGSYIVLADVPDVGNVGELRLVSGDTITATVCGEVNYLSGNIQIDLSNASEFSATDAQDIRAKYRVKGYFLKFHAPSVIEHLATDFGFNMDQADPEDVQRSTIANITKFWGLKSTYDSYSIRGDISLFNVDMIGLYRVNSPAIAATLPSEHVFEIVDNIYTDIKPLYIKYDHIASDEVFYDYNDGGTAAWTNIIDNMFIFDNADRWDGMSIGMAYAVDVTQGYYGQISEVNSNVRGPVTVSDVTQLTTDELNTLGWQNGFRYELTMLRCQYEAFNFVEGLFTLSVYDYNADPDLGTPPSMDDISYYIQLDSLIDESLQDWQLVSEPTADEDEDIGTCSVLIQFGPDVVTSPIEVNDTIAIRYLPTFDGMDCSYCRSNSMRAIVSAKDEAYEYYDTYAKIDDAIRRLKPKLEYLTPTHTRIIEYEVTRKFEDVMYGAQNGASVIHELDGSQFVGNTEVKLTVQYKGDAVTSGEAIDLWIDSEEDPGTRIWGNATPSPNPWYDAACTTNTWVNVVTDEVITVNDDEASPGVPYKIYLHADSDADSAYGDVKFIFTVTKKEQ